MQFRILERGKTMEKTKLKICGIKDYDTLDFCNNHGVHFIGLVFTTSKRMITPDNAKQLLSKLECRRSKIVGVFNGESEELIRNIALDCQLDYIQIHSSKIYSPSLFAEFNVIRALPYNACITPYLKSLKLSKYILIDSCTPGSGLAFDWTKLGLDTSTYNLIIAGGINSTNLVEAITTFHPQVIDISSGVENNGKKDITKIKEVLKILGGNHEL